MIKFFNVFNVGKPLKYRDATASLHGFFKTQHRIDRKRGAFQVGCRHKYLLCQHGRMEDKGSMSLGQNLQFLRKRDNLTQEGLAEHMQVSRQTISKWESDASYPEMDKLLQLCDMFGCSMDELLRGDLEQMYVEDVCGYDAHMNSFIRRITAGVVLLIVGAGMIIAMEALAVNEYISVAAFLFCVLISVTILVVSGLEHSHFTEKNKNMPMIYKQDEVDEFNGKKFPMLIAGGVAVIIGGVIIQQVLSHILADMMGAKAEDAASSVFLFIVAVGVGLLVYGGLQKSKYNIEEYNKSINPTEEEKRQDDRVGAWCGSIMMAAAAIYLIGGFGFHGFGTWWVVFPVGGIICGIAVMLLKMKK